MTLFDLIARAVEAEEVDVVFAVMGDGNMRWLASLEQGGRTRVIYARHEGAAAAMADGYARATQRLAVCTVTCGPGLALLSTTLIAASRNRSPLLVIAGDGPRRNLYYEQNFDQSRFVEASEAVARDLREAGTAREDLAGAFALARRGHATVLSIPYDVQEDAVPGDAEYVPSTELVVGPQAIRPAPEPLAQAVELLGRSERPLVVAGRGASHLRDEVEALADRCGAMLATTLKATGLFAGHPRDLGVMGGLATARAREIARRADCVLGIGTSLSHLTSDKGALFAGARVIQIDREPPQLVYGRHLPRRLPAGTGRADCYVQADAGVAVEELMAALPPRERNGWASTLAELDVPAPASRPFELPPGTIHPRDALRTLADAVDDRTLFVVGVGHFWWFATTFLPGRRSHRFQYMTEFAAIGLGLGDAIGAAVAVGDHHRVVLVEGDASLMMSIQELDTAVRHGVDLLVVVMNDGGLGAEVHKLKALGLPTDSARIGSPDFAAIAQSHGGRGVRVDTEDALRAAVADLQPKPGPSLIDVAIAPNVVSDPYWDAHFAARVADGGNGSGLGGRADVGLEHDRVV